MELLLLWVQLLLLSQLHVIILFVNHGLVYDDLKARWLLLPLLLLQFLLTITGQNNR